MALDVLGRMEIPEGARRIVITPGFVEMGSAQERECRKLGERAAKCADVLVIVNKVIARISGHTDCDIQPCYSSEYPSPVTRPAYSVLDKRSIKETFGVKVPYWVDSLEKCIAHLEAAK